MALMHRHYDLQENEIIVASIIDGVKSTHVELRNPDNCHYEPCLWYATDNSYHPVMFSARCSPARSGFLRAIAATAVSCTQIIRIGALSLPTRRLGSRLLLKSTKVLLAGGFSLLQHAPTT